jgi:hypothetical protein
MSGLEWMIVTVIGVLLILGFVILELLFPAADHSEENGIADDRPMRRPVRNRRAV